MIKYTFKLSQPTHELDVSRLIQLPFKTGVTGQGVGGAVDSPSPPVARTVPGGAAGWALRIDDTKYTNDVLHRRSVEGSKVIYVSFFELQFLNQYMLN
jgi:hypothetical protein